MNVKDELEALSVILDAFSQMTAHERRRTLAYLKEWHADACTKEEDGEEGIANEWGDR